MELGLRSVALAIASKNTERQRLAYKHRKNTVLKEHKKEGIKKSSSGLLGLLSTPPRN